MRHQLEHLENDAVLKQLVVRVLTLEAVGGSFLEARENYSEPLGSALKDR